LISGTLPNTAAGSYPVTVTVSDGKFNIYAQTTTLFIADLTGYFAPPPSGAPTQTSTPMPTETPTPANIAVRKTKHQ